MSLYERLGVAITATKKEIKSAYLKLAAKHHPDKSGGDEKEFKLVNHAYDVLNNTDKREHYDKTGDDGSLNSNPDAAIMSIFSLVLEGGDFHGNLISRIIEKIKNDISNGELALTSFDEKISKLKGQKGRISAKSENLFEMLLDGKIEDLNKLKALTQSNIDKLNDLENMVGDYCDENPQEVTAPSFGMQGMFGR